LPPFLVFFPAATATVSIDFLGQSLVTEDARLRTFCHFCGTLTVLSRTKSQNKAQNSIKVKQKVFFYTSLPQKAKKPKRVDSTDCRQWRS